MSRETALQVLISCRTRGAWADAALQAQLRSKYLERQDAALCSRIVYGVLQNQLLLDYYLESFCSQKLEHLQPPLWDILRIGAYQILFLDKVPDSAAVNTSVELAKKHKRAQAAGLVNAVLRRLAQSKEDLPPLPDKDPLKNLSIRYSHPRWLVKRLISLVGQEEAEAFMACGNSQPPTTVQVNTCKVSTPSLLASLAEAGVTAEPHPWLPDCLLLQGTGELERLEAFRAGGFYVQDPAARMAVMAAGIKPHSWVLDMCAAPGGKSFAAGILMKDRGEILSCDLHGGKLKRIQEGAARLGLTCLRTAAADGRVFNQAWSRQFDVVLADVPCSGLGIIRKKPDIRYKRSNDLFALPVIQRTILETAARYVRPGGTLLYSTCTILPEENQEVTGGFLAEHPEYAPAPFTLPGPVGECAGEVTLWPQRHGTDGFYICRMTRQG